MRIIAGRWRGRRLTAPPGNDLRPTTDRVKEALFNILQGDLAGLTVLDLCCGAGGLGIEALSRGAKLAVFVDRDPRALAATRANLTHCGAESASYRLVQGDALEQLRRQLEAPPVERWCLLADPPYAAGLAEAILAQAPDLLAAPGLQVAVIEHGRDVPASVLTGGKGRTRRYGRSCLTILRPGAGEGSVSDD